MSLESEDIINDYKLIRKELGEISEKLSTLPEIIILTKSDLVSKEKLETQVKKVEAIGAEIYITSAYDFESLQLLRGIFKDKIKA